MTEQTITKLIINVYYSNNSRKASAVSSTITAKELTILMGERTALYNSSSFGIFLVKDDEERLLDENELVCKVMISEVISPEADFDKFFERMNWEYIRKEFSDDSKLVFKRKFLLKNEIDFNNDEALINLTMEQEKCEILKGNHPCSDELAIELAALMMQSHFGDYRKDYLNPGFLKDKIQHFIPLSLLKVKKFEEIENEVFDLHIKLKGMKRIDAMLIYISTVSKLDFYGSRFWIVESMNTNNHLIPKKLILSVSSNGIQFVNIESKEIIQNHNFKDIQCWGFQKKCFGFISNTYSKEKYQFITLNGKDISKLLEEISNLEKKGIILKKNQNEEINE